MAYLVLLDADVEGHVVRLGPASEGRQPEHRVLVSLPSTISNQTKPWAGTTGNGLSQAAGDGRRGGQCWETTKTTSRSVCGEQDNMPGGRRC